MRGAGGVCFALDFHMYGEMAQPRLLAELAHKAELTRLRIRVGENHG